MPTSGTTSEAVEVILRRTEFLKSLSEGSKTKQTLPNKQGIYLLTIAGAIRELASLDLAADDENEFEDTILHTSNKTIEWYERTYREYKRESDRSTP